MDKKIKTAAIILIVLSIILGVLALIQFKELQTIENELVSQKEKVAEYEEKIVNLEENQFIEFTNEEKGQILIDSIGERFGDFELVDVSFPYGNGHVFHLDYQGDEEHYTGFKLDFEYVGEGEEYEITIEDKVAAIEPPFLHDSEFVMADMVFSDKAIGVKNSNFYLKPLKYLVKNRSSRQESRNVEGYSREKNSQPFIVLSTDSFDVFGSLEQIGVTDLRFEMDAETVEGDGWDGRLNVYDQYGEHWIMMAPLYEVLGDFEAIENGEITHPNKENLEKVLNWIKERNIYNDYINDSIEVDYSSPLGQEYDEFRDAMVEER